MNKTIPQFLPDRSIHIREVAGASAQISRTGKPYVRVNLVPDGVIFLGPIDYPKACVEAGVSPKTVYDKFNHNDPWSMWPHCEKDPSFLVGKHVRFIVKWEEVKEATWQTFRFICLETSK